MWAESRVLRKEAPQLLCSEANARAPTFLVPSARPSSNSCSSRRPGKPAGSSNTPRQERVAPRAARSRAQVGPRALPRRMGTPRSTNRNVCSATCGRRRPRSRGVPARIRARRPMRPSARFRRVLGVGRFVRPTPDRPHPTARCSPTANLPKTSTPKRLGRFGSPCSTAHRRLRASSAAIRGLIVADRHRIVAGHQPGH